MRLTGAMARLIHSYGIDDFIDFKEVSDVPKKVKDLTGGRGAHGVIVVAASSKGYEDSIKYLRPHGKLVAVGMPPDTFIKAEVFWTIVNSLTYSGSYVGNRQGKHLLYLYVEINLEVWTDSPLPSLPPPPFFPPSLRVNPFPPPPRCHRGPRACRQGQG